MWIRLNPFHKLRPPSGGCAEAEAEAEAQACVPPAAAALLMSARAHTPQIECFQYIPWCLYKYAAGRARFHFSGRRPGKINEICLWCTSFCGSALAAAAFYFKFQTRANWVLAKCIFISEICFFYTFHTMPEEQRLVKFKASMRLLEAILNNQFHLIYPF